MATIRKIYKIRNPLFTIILLMVLKYENIRIVINGQNIMKICYYYKNENRWSHNWPWNQVWPNFVKRTADSSSCKIIFITFQTTKRNKNVKEIEIEYECTNIFGIHIFNLRMLTFKIFIMKSMYHLHKYLPKIYQIYLLYE